MDTQELIERPSDRLGIVIEEHPFDRGYWARFNGKQCPSDHKEAEGWHCRFHEAIGERCARAALNGEKP